MLSFSSDEFWEDEEEPPRDDCEPLDRINAWISDGRLVSLVEPTYEDGAGNGLDANLYGGGFKHFDIEGFIQVVMEQKWKSPSKVQLWIKGGQEGISDNIFSLIKFGPRVDAALKAAATRKRRAAAATAVKTRKRRAAARKAVATRKGKRSK
jgi:hypothetical protein